MNFKEKIAAHQKGEYDFTRELVDLALSLPFKTTMTVTYHELPTSYYDHDLESVSEYTLSLPRWRATYSEGKTFEERLARNFVVMIARFVKKANGKRSSLLLEGSQTELMDVDNDRLHFIYSKLVEYGYDCYKDDFDKLPLNKICDEIEKREDWYIRDEFETIIKPFIDALLVVNREKNKLKEVYVPLIEQALNDIIPKIDLKRTEKDIIAFIAVSVRNAVSRSITKKLKTKVHQIGGKKYYVTFEKIRGNGFKHITPNTILKIDINKLNASQYLFFDMLCIHIQKEIDNLNTNVFSFSEEGKVIGINKRYFSEKMNLEESAFKHRLKRLSLLKNKPTD